jgi:hypothetical protein
MSPTGSLGEFLKKGDEVKMLNPYEAMAEVEQGVRELATDAERTVPTTLTVRVKSSSRRTMADSSRKGMPNPGRCEHFADFRPFQPS